jgi:hypothetical protein
VAYKLDGTRNGYRRREAGSLMVSVGPNPELIQVGETLGEVIGDPITGFDPLGSAIGMRSGKRYGIRASTMGAPERENILSSASPDQIIRDPADPQEMYLQVTNAPIPDREGEVEIDVSEMVTGKQAFDEMTAAWETDKDTWEQIAEGLLMNGYTSFEEDPEEIYDYDVVVDGMYRAIGVASNYASRGGAGIGMMPTIDALLKATDPADLQAEFNRITETKRPPQYTRATITEYANKQFREKLHRGPTTAELKTIIGTVHSLQGQQNVKFDLGSEIGGMATDLDPQRAQGVSYYNTANVIKNALGLKGAVRT